MSDVIANRRRKLRKKAMGHINDRNYERATD